ncbi:MAG TPA: MarR family transcriptional regulator [Rhizomicrobium sp.]|nr:MarR family transcriptional regulator [Rhizomicrobium sp.]
MTETSDTIEALPPAIERFVLNWGDMGDRWGVNRSVSQIHALLYLSDRPLTAEEIADRLGMARSNVSNSLKELLGWELIRRVPVMGDRRDHFEAETDVWTIAARIAAGRRQRELDPALAALASCAAAAESDPRVSPAAKKRLREMEEFTRTAVGWYDQMTRVPRPTLMALIRLGGKIASLLPARKAK